MKNIECSSVSSSAGPDSFILEEPGGDGNTLLGSTTHGGWQKDCPESVHNTPEMVWNQDRAVREDS